MSELLDEFFMGFAAGAAFQALVVYAWLTRLCRR